MNGVPANFHFHDLQPSPEDFQAEVIAGLSQERKSLSPKFFYDERGSRLFDAITRLPEYYPTRTEIDLLNRHGDDMAGMLGDDGLLFELGSGSDTKIRVLLDALQPLAYAPIDISHEHLRRSAGAIARDHPALQVHAVCADYSRSLALPRLVDAPRRSGFFPGSSIGNFDPAQARELLPRIAARCGDVHAVVNNASVFEHDDAQSFGYECLMRHLATNTAAPVVLAQALHRHVQARSGDGVVVNLLDQKLWNQNPDFLSYTLSKAALEAANTALAMALAPLVRVVGVAPGLTLTSHMLTQEKFEQLHRMAPLGRSSTPADIAHAVRFALENQAITGTTLLVDGGQHLMKLDRDFSMM
jgi:NAD(P)-dependent dehydrogenase (short-subunit alcohol dehydrogenase family)